jgi:Fuc2NAc and GlcNAc transferase
MLTRLVSGLLLLGPLAAVSSYVFTGLARRHALRHAILDVPNQRSSHSVPTPRGGGLGVAIVSLGGVVVAYFLGAITDRVAIALVGGGLLIAAIGWADDRSSQRATTRLAIQLVAAIWAVAWLGGLPALQFGRTTVLTGMMGTILAVLGVMWSTNLYNFMDGIDGIAAVEAVSVGALGGTLLWLTSNPGLSIVAFTVAAANLGFLPWNWPPAKVFMGDVGSSLLGFFFASLAIASENSKALPVVWWILLLLVFVFDATVTLFRRGLARESLYVAHREHAYQRAVASGFRHTQVTGAVAVINISLAMLALTGAQHAAVAPFVFLSGLSIVAAFYFVIERKKPMRKKM